MTAEKRLLENGYDGVKYLTNYSYDGALIGVTDDGRAVYDYELMVEWLMDTEGWYRLRNLGTGEYLTWIGDAARTAEQDINLSQFWHFSQSSRAESYVLCDGGGHNLLGEAAPGENDSVQLMRKNGGYQIALPDTDFGRSLMPGGNRSIRFADSDGSKEQIWALEPVD